MKKAILIILSLFMIVMIIMTHIFAFQLVSFHPSSQSSTLKEYIQYDSIFYTTEKESESQLLNKTVNDIKDFLNSTPDKYRDFKKDGWKIIISTHPPTYITEIEEKVGYKVAGNTYREYRLIYLYFNEKQPEYLLEDFIHEFGHYVDWSVGYVSHSKDFEKIYDKYKDGFKDDSFVVQNYTSISPTEFFASCYKDYYINAEALKDGYPELYDFIESSITDDFLVFYKRLINYYF